MISGPQKMFQNFFKGNLGSSNQSVPEMAVD